MMAGCYGIQQLQTGLLTLALGFASITCSVLPALASDEIIRNSCEKELRLSDSGCDCVVSKANASLNENQMTFFLAAIQQDQQAMIASQSKLSGDEMLAVTEFMTSTPSACQNQ